jgi:hypothetical protein
MAIAPDDCIIDLRKVSTTKEQIGWHGKPETVLEYPDYWTKFLKNAVSKTPKNGAWEDYDITLKAELKKAGIVYKQTKKGGEYIKFRSEKDMLMFMLRWS